MQGQAKVNYLNKKIEVTNRRGRPTGEKTKKFGPEPKSMIISQILNELNKQRKIKSYIPDNKIDSPIETGQIPLETHSKTAILKQYSCSHPGCKYTSKESSNLTKHVRIHTKEKPYLCDQCSFRTNFVNSLKAHKRLHSDEKPYVCEYCSYRCNSTSNLKKHHQHRHANKVNR